MKSRRWVLIVASILIFWLLLIYHGWNLFQANEKIKNFLLEELRPVLGTGFDIKKVLVGLGTIHVMGISVNFTDRPYSIYVEDLQADYNLTRLISSGFDPKQLSDDIYVRGLKLTINPRFQSSQTKVDSTDNLTHQDNFENKYRKHIKQFNFIRRIAFIKSEIILNDTSGNNIIITDIDGWAHSRDDEIAELVLDGKLYAAEKSNVYITGSFNFQTGAVIHLSGILSKFELPRKIPFSQEKFIEIQSGRLGGHFYITQDDTSTTGMTVTGTVELDSCAANLPGRKIAIRNLTTTLNIGNWNATLSQTSGFLNESKFTLSGQIQNILNPELNLTFNFHDVNLDTFFQKLKPEWFGKVTGQAQIAGEITGPPASATVSARFYSPHLILDNYTAANVFLTASYNNKRLNVPYVTGRVLQQKIYGAGFLLFRNRVPQISARLDLNGNLQSFLTKFKFDSTLQCTSHMTTFISGSVKEPTVKGTFDVTMTSAQNDSFRLPGEFLLVKKDLGFKITESITPFKASGHINFANKTNPDFSLELINLQSPVCYFFNFPFKSILKKYLVVNLSATGQLKNLKISGQTKLNLPRAQKEKPVITFALTRRVQRQQVIYQSKFKLMPEAPAPIAGELKWSTDNQGIDIQKFQLGESIYGTARIPFARSELLSGSITAQNAKINEYFLLPDSLLTGQFAADLEIGGVPGQPCVNGQVNFYETYYQGQIGPYASNFDFQYCLNAFRLKNFVLNRADTTLLIARGHYLQAEDELDLTLKGIGFNIAAFEFLFPWGRPLLQGKTYIDAAIKGTTKRPEIQGILAVEDGTLGQIAFDELKFFVDTGANLTAGTQSPALQLTRMSLVRQGQFRMEGYGQIPLTETGTWNINLEGNGNLLFFLPDLLSYFRLARAPGKIDIKIGGTLNHPEVTHGMAEFNDGKLVMASVVSEVTRLHGKLEYQPENHFVKLHHLTGHMGGKPFTITNVASDSMTPVSLPSHYFDFLKLNFGIVLINTFEEGVPLNFLGLMAPGDFGKFRLVGLEDNESFIFAGPIHQPTVRGKIIASNMLFMYPFIEGHPVKKSDKVVNYLRNTRWDLLVIPDTGNRFQRSFPGALDEVYVDLSLDENYGSLHMTGIVADSSFRINGQVRSTRGTVEYLHMNFRIEEAGALFDRTTIDPVVYGRAVTTITDSTGYLDQVYLSLSTIDKTLEDDEDYELVKNEQHRGRWSDVHFRLSSDNANFGNSEGQLLVALGYSPEMFQERAFDAVGNITDNLIFKPLIRPVERKLAKTFKLDYVRFSSRLARNIIAQNVYEDYASTSKLAFLRSSRVMMGKYINENLFLLYTGIVQVGNDYRLQVPGVGMHHSLDLEYRINPRLLIELAYNYDGLMRQKRYDTRVLIKHWFPF